MGPEFAIALYYFTFLGALGTFWPFFTLWLAHAGLQPGEITRVMSVYPLAGLIGPPLFGLVADAFRARGSLLRAASAGTLLAFSGFFFARGFKPALYATMAAFAFFRGPILAMADATTFEHVVKHGGSFGRVRLWGSVGFLLAALGAGALCERLGIEHMVDVTAAGLFVAALCAWRLPAPPPERRPQALDAWLRLLERPALWLLLGATALAQLAMAAFDACFSLHLKALGATSGFVGVAWAVGVGAEVLLMAVSQRFIVRYGADKLFAASIATAALRWLLLATVTTPAAALALQPLHGMSFGVFYVCGVTLARERGGAEAPTAAQGLFAGALALGSVTGMQLAGRVYERVGGQGLFRAAAAVASLGCVCAVGHALRRGHHRDAPASLRGQRG